jgi:hypothetical protein
VKSATWAPPVVPRGAWGAGGEAESRFRLSGSHDLGPAPRGRRPVTLDSKVFARPRPPIQRDRGRGHVRFGYAPPEFASRARSFDSRNPCSEGSRG